MARCVEGDQRMFAKQHLLLILKPVIRQRHGDKGHTKHAALHLKILPQIEIVLMQAQSCPRRLLHLPGSKKMVEVGMGMQDMADRKAEFRYFVENARRVAAGIDHNGSLRNRVADD